MQQRFWAQGSLFGWLVFVLAIVLGSSMVNDDVRAGTIFGVLARPVPRSEYFVGCWSAAALLLLAVELMRCAVALGVALSLNGRVSAAFLVAMVAVLAGDLLCLATFAALGAWFSTGVAVFVGLSFLFIEMFAFVPKVPAWIAYPLRALAVLLPISTIADGTIVKSLTDATREVTPLFEIIAYRLCWTTALLCLGIAAFIRRELAPRTY